MKSYLGPCYSTCSPVQGLPGSGHSVGRIDLKNIAEHQQIVVEGGTD